MLNFGSCPVCKNEIENERLNDTVVSCNHCGWSDTRSDLAVRRFLTKRFVLTSTTLSVMIVAAFVHLVNWGKYSVEIFPLKVAQALNMGSVADYNRIAEICRELEKPLCVEGAYFGILNQDSQNAEALAAYGKILVQQDKINEALDAYAQYFQRGGQDLDVAASYASALGKAKRVDEATVYYRKAIDGKPEVFQRTVTEEFVRLLISSARLKEAKEVIEETRKRGDNAPYFMDFELGKIMTVLGGSKES